MRSRFSSIRYDVSCAVFVYGQYKNAASLFRFAAYQKTEFFENFLDILSRYILSFITGPNGEN